MVCFVLCDCGPDGGGESLPLASVKTLCFDGIVSRFRSACQNFFRAGCCRRTLLIAGLAAGGAAGWYFLGEVAVAPGPPSREPARPAVLGTPMAMPLESSAPPDAPLPAVPPIREPRLAPAEPSPVANPHPPVAELERRFRGADASGERSDLAHAIAGRNDAAAVLALGRIFRTERNPVVKAAILSALGDVDASVAPGERLATLDSALRGQPRDVRIAALGSLTQLKDPRSLALLLHASQEDADVFVRETAAALYKARKEASEQ